MNNKKLRYWKHAFEKCFGTSTSTRTSFSTMYTLLQYNHDVLEDERKILTNHPAPKPERHDTDTKTQWNMSKRTLLPFSYCCCSIVYIIYILRHFVHGWHFICTNLLLLDLQTKVTKLGKDFPGLKSAQKYISLHPRKLEYVWKRRGRVGGTLHWSIIVLWGANNSH